VSEKFFPTGKYSKYSFSRIPVDLLSSACPRPRPYPSSQVLVLVVVLKNSVLDNGTVME